jgi:hypothetical protein
MPATLPKVPSDCIPETSQSRKNQSSRPRADRQKPIGSHPRDLPVPWVCLPLCRDACWFGSSRGLGRIRLWRQHIKELVMGMRADPGKVPWLWLDIGCSSFARLLTCSPAPPKAQIVSGAFAELDRPQARSSTGERSLFEDRAWDATPMALHYGILGPILRPLARYYWKDWRGYPTIVIAHPGHETCPGSQLSRALT